MRRQRLISQRDTLTGRMVHAWVYEDLGPGRALPQHGEVPAGRTMRNVLTLAALGERKPRSRAV